MFMFHFFFPHQLSLFFTSHFHLSFLLSPVNIQLSLSKYTFILFEKNHTFNFCFQLSKSRALQTMITECSTYNSFSSDTGYNISKKRNTHTLSLRFKHHWQDWQQFFTFFLIKTNATFGAAYFLLMIVNISVTTLFLANRAKACKQKGLNAPPSWSTEQQKIANIQIQLWIRAFTTLANMLMSFVFWKYSLSNHPL